MTRARGRALRGQRLIGVVSHGHVWTPLPEQEESTGRVLRVTGCGHVFGLCCGRQWPRARMGCGDQVHIIGSRSERYPCAWFS
jgi:hypothetical protein